MPITLFQPPLGEIGEVDSTMAEAAATGSLQCSQNAFIHIKDCGGLCHGLRGEHRLGSRGEF